MLQSPSKTTRAQRLLIAGVAAAYGLAVVGGATPTLAATLVSAAAIAALGAALFAYVAARVGPAPQRLGGRAQLAERRYGALALATIGMVCGTRPAGRSA